MDKVKLLLLDYGSIPVNGKQLNKGFKKFQF